MKADSQGMLGVIHAFGKLYAYRHWRWYLSGFLALAVTNYVTLKIPEMAKLIVNMVESGDSISEAPRTALLMVGLGLVLIFIRSLSRVLVFWPGRVIEADVKYGLFDKILSLPAKVLFNFSVGDLISRISNDTGQIRVLYAFAVLQLVNLAFLVALTITQMASVHTGLTVACISPLLAMIFISRYAMPRMHVFSRRNQEALGQLTGRVGEAFIHAHVLQVNAAEPHFVKRVQEKNQEVYDTDMKLVFIRNFVFPMMGALAGVCEMIILLYGGMLVIDGAVTVGDILAFNVYVGYLSWPLTSMGVVLGIIQRARVAMERVNEVTHSPGRVVERLPSGIGAQPAGSQAAVAGTQPLIELSDVTFSYPAPEGRALVATVSTAPAEPIALGAQAKERFLLEVKEFKIYPGERVGICGAVGSGKSTLFQLMAGVWEPDSGVVRHGGVPLKALPLDELRERVGYLRQSSQLFSDSVFNNIALPRQGAEAESVEAVAGLAQIHDDILRFPEGYGTEIGERGIRLSGGQKQRLVLARGLLQGGEVLLVDDALSAVDEPTEKMILDGIFGRFDSLVVASHRISVLKRCHRLYLLENGRLRPAALEEVQAL